MTTPHMCSCGGGVHQPTPHLCVCGAGAHTPTIAPHMCVCGGGVPPAPVAPPPPPKNTSGFNPMSINLGDKVPPGGQVTYGYIVTVPPQALKSAARSQHSIGRPSASSIVPEKKLSISDVLNNARETLKKHEQIERMKGNKVDFTGAASDIIKNAAMNVQQYQNESQRSPSGGDKTSIKPFHYDQLGSAQKLIAEAAGQYALQVKPQQEVAPVGLPAAIQTNLATVDPVSNSFKEMEADATINASNVVSQLIDSLEKFEDMIDSQMTSTMVSPNKPFKDVKDTSDANEFKSLMANSSAGSSYGSPPVTSASNRSRSANLQSFNDHSNKSGSRQGIAMDTASIAGELEGLLSPRRPYPDSFHSFEPYSRIPSSKSSSGRDSPSLVRQRLFTSGGSGLPAPIQSNLAAVHPVSKSKIVPQSNKSGSRQGFHMDTPSIAKELEGVLSPQHSRELLQDYKPVYLDVTPSAQILPSE